MRRLIKFFFNLGLALLAVALTFGIIFFIKPTWQKAAMERILAGDAGRKWQVETVEIRPSQVELEGLRVLDGLVGAEVEHLSLQGPFWKSPFSGIIEVTGGEVRGLYVDMVRFPVDQLTKRDWQSFLYNLRNDQAFWEERLGLIMSKLSDSGVPVRAVNLKVSGSVLLPDDEIIPFHWLILEADTRSPGTSRLKPVLEKTANEL